MKWEYPYISDSILFSKVREIDKYLKEQPAVRACSHGIQINNVILASNKRIFKVKGCQVWASFSTKPFAEAINNGEEIKYLKKRIREDIAVFYRHKAKEGLCKEKRNTAYRIDGYKRAGLINGKSLKRSVTSGL